MGRTLKHGAERQAALDALAVVAVRIAASRLPPSQRHELADRLAIVEAYLRQPARAASGAGEDPDVSFGGP